MKKYKLKRGLVSLGGMAICLLLTSCAYLGFLNPFYYYKEMNQIKKELNSMENIEVINIWGHKDITLEEITARIKIKDKGEIVLANLNSNDNNYPKSVYIYEIGGYSFTTFSCNGGIGSSINIGTHGNLGSLFDEEFHTVRDVLDNYDMIYEKINNLKIFPEANYIENEKSRVCYYIYLHKENSIDQDPIFNLVGIFDMFEYAKTLEWNCKNHYSKYRK